jgi:hypothetical protein
METSFFFNLMGFSPKPMKLEYFTFKKQNKKHAVSSSRRVILIHNHMRNFIFLTYQYCKADLQLSPWNSTICFCTKNCGERCTVKG